MDLKNTVPGFFKEQGLKHRRIQKVAFPERMQISLILVPLAAPLKTSNGDAKDII